MMSSNAINNILRSEMILLMFAKKKNEFICFVVVAGYGFVDFESPACAEGAVKGLQSKGIQAQMAKVGIWMLHRPAIVRLFCMQVIFNPLFSLPQFKCNLSSPIRLTLFGSDSLA